MNNKTFVIAAIALGLVAALLNYVYLSSSQTEGLTVLRVRPDVTASAGALPAYEWFEPVTIYGEIGQLKNFVVTQDDFANFQSVPLTETLGPGDLLRLSSFAVSGDSGLRQDLKQGERAITISVANEEKAAAYFVRPGDVVDLWGNFNGQAILLKERARVAAVGEIYKVADAGTGTDRAFRTITLFVPETDVSPLLTNISVAGGSVTVSLVGPEDSKLQPKPATQSLATIASQQLANQAANKGPRPIVMPAATAAPAPAAAAPAPAAQPQPQAQPPQQ